jgi:DNA-binding NarL/FixJ family response regulator
VPFEEGRIVAGLIPGARFVPIEGRNHVLLEGEPAFAEVFSALNEFLRSGARPAQGTTAFPDLTPREREILELVAHGLDNSQIGARLDLSEKTVRNNVSRIFDKIAAENRSQTIVQARNAGFGQSPPPPQR